MYNYLLMDDSYKKDGKYYIGDKGFKQLLSQASSEEETKYIKGLIHSTFSDFGYSYRLVYIMRRSCGHYEIFQCPARNEEEAMQRLREATIDSEHRKCSRCIRSFEGGDRND
ncbi:MAG: hypothetical protein IIY45_02885 [Firmicutes bacterium]|nr:hypothetical protein [Bacillota bacterium]